MTASDAVRIARSFGIAAEDGAAHELRGGYSNDTWRVTRRDPPGAFAVRRYGRLHVSRYALAFEHAVAEHLAERMPEVVAPVRDAAGDTLHLDGGAYVAVLPFMAGETDRRDADTGVAAARVLARFHLAGRDMHVSGGTRSTRFLGIVPWLISRFRRFAAPESPVARGLPWDELIVALSASTVRMTRRAAELPHAIVHGDPTPGNVVVRNGDVTGLIDFDFVHETERIYDVGAFVDEFARSDDDAPLSFERMRSLVAAYDAAAALAPAERDTLADAMLRRAATLVWYVVSRHGERSPGDVGAAPRYAARVREIAGALEAIRDAA